nr:hypothetical protein [Tanacetum cinerariifolium]
MFDCDNCLSSGSDESLPPSPTYDRYQSSDGYHAVPPPYIGTFMPPKLDLVFNNAPNDVKTNHPAFNVKLSPTSLTKTCLTPIDPHHLSQRIGSLILRMNLRPRHHRLFLVLFSLLNKTRKACFVCKSLDHLIKDYDYHEKKMAQPTARDNAKRGNHKQYAQMTILIPQRHVVPAAVLTQSKHVPINVVRPVRTAAPKISVTRTRQAKIIVTKPNSPPRRHINRSPSPKANNSPPRVTAIKAPVVNAAKGMQGKWEWKLKCPVLDHVSCNTSASMILKMFDCNDALERSKVIDSGCLRHMTGNMSYLSDFKEPNGGYVAFGGNPKGGKISGKASLGERPGEVWCCSGFIDRRSKQPFALEESLVDTMVDQRTMAELLCAPTEGYAEAIMVPSILDEQFELKHSLINMMTTDQFFRLKKDNPHDHIRWGSPPVARKRTPAFDESFHEAWDRYKDLLRAFPHHGFTEFHQLDTFYNALNPADQDSLNATAGGNLMERRTQDVLTIIENKSKDLMLSRKVDAVG